MSLRDDLTEAVARRMFEAAHPDGKWMMSGSGKKRREVWRQRAVPAVDAVLDTLADRADEWWDAWFDSSRDLYDSLNDDHIRQLIAALRGDTEKGRE